jgi:hypothetical protein
MRSSVPRRTFIVSQPRWHDLVPGVWVQLRPLTTSLMVATRSDPVVDNRKAVDSERAPHGANPVLLQLSTAG